MGKSPRVDLTGQRFGHWTVLESAPRGKYGHVQWTCRCDCGSIRLVTHNHLTTGHSKSCGCVPCNFRDLTGQRFGRLTVLERGPSAKSRQSRWFCRCDCGGTALVESCALTRGHTTSCGCAHTDAVTTHGRNRTPEYRAWVSMRRRCYAPKDISYPRYGALGIRVCDRWLHSFENFFADMGERPGPGYSLDRIDSKADYSPENCRWATAATQAQNRRSSCLLTFQGKTQTVSQWSRELGISGTCIHTRLKKGWATEKVLSLPVRSAHAS